jgi:hypothetical protein
MTNPFTQVYTADLFDPLFQDDRVLATYVRMKAAAGGMYPSPAAISRSTDMNVVDKLIAARRVLLVGKDFFTMPEVTSEREARVKGGLVASGKAMRGSDGRFLPDQQPVQPVAGSVVRVAPAMQRNVEQRSNKAAIGASNSSHETGVLEVGPPADERDDLRAEVARFDSATVERW